MKFRTIANTGKLIAFLAVISLASCKKDGTSSNSNESNAANLTDSSTAADNMYYDVLNNAFVGFSDNSSVWNTSTPHSGQTTTFSTGVEGTATNLGCAIYSIDDTIPGEYPKTLTLDFGTGCTSADGILRKGKLIYLFSGPLLVPGATAAVTFDQYVVNGYGILGTYAITNNSSDVLGISFTTQVTNGIITYPNASNYHYNANKTYTMTAGSVTPFDISDDVYSVSGNSSFSSSNGSSLVCTVTTPLVKAVTCHNVSAGVVSFVYDQVVNGTLDFGNGTCDNQATLKIGANITRTITLR
jgi:hypothetical protein